MKHHIEIISHKKSGSRDSVHSFCIYEAPDALENTWQVFSIYQVEIKELPGFKLENGLNVKVFLGGDYEFLSKSLGHQGQSATYPSLTDLVTLEHLRNHTGKPHNEKDCAIPLRDRNNYNQNFSENIQDFRSKQNLRKNATQSQLNNLSNAFSFI